MIFKLTILNVVTGLLGLLLLGALVINYEGLAGNGGWGLVGVAALLVIATGGAILDIILQQIIQNRILLNVIEFLIVFYVYIRLDTL